MLSADGNVVVTFNGEIYNYKALRQRLEAQGHTFRSNSDTEVLIELYRSRGPDFVSDLRGMFAFALWDQGHEHLLLARDPYGIKPLYYTDADGIVSFASSVKALMGQTRLSRAADPAGVAGFFVFGSVPEPWTIYEAARAVTAGSTLLVDHSGVQEPRRYHSIAKVMVEAEIEAGANAGRAMPAADSLREALLDSVRHHLVADVPVGAFLSAGVDSSALVGLMRDAGHSDIQTITLAYDEFTGKQSNEAPIAEAVARHYGTRHTTRWISAEEFHSDLPKIMIAMDQPSIDGINTWFISKAAHELGLKVAISGIGGDELLGGYSNFWILPRLERALAVPSRIYGLAGFLQKAVGAARALGLDVHPKHAGLLRYGGSLPGAYLLQRGLFLPMELREVLENPTFLSQGIGNLKPLEILTQALAEGPRTAFGKVAALETSFYLRNQLLRDTDWASMAHSLEVRTPLVDHVLLRRAAPVMLRPAPPNGKVLLAAAPRKPVPDAVVNRKKTGFGIPTEAWLEKMHSRDAKDQSRDKVFSRHWARLVADWHHAVP